jgi:hypothetical protein
MRVKNAIASSNTAIPSEPLNAFRNSVMYRMRSVDYERHVKSTTCLKLKKAAS